MPVHAQEPDRERTVAGLAEEFHMPVGAVAALYERERAELARGARVTAFLHIFVVRNVQDALRKRGLPAAAVTTTAMRILRDERGADSRGP